MKVAVEYITLKSDDGENNWNAWSQENRIKGIVIIVLLCC